MASIATQASYLISAALLSAPALLGQSGNWAWKEYVYSRDGFAIMFPLAPARAQDPHNHSISMYTIHFSVDSGLTLRVDHGKRDCAATLEALKLGALQNNQSQQPIKPSSVREVSLGKYPGLEYEFRSDTAHLVYDRFYCVDGRFYTFTAQWRVGQPRPAAVNRTIESFRISKANSSK